MLVCMETWADVTVTLSDGSANSDPYVYGVRSNSNKTFTTDGDAGLAGVVLDVTGAIDKYTNIGSLALKTSAANTDETWTLTAPEGYLIKGYSFSAQAKGSGQTCTITAGGTTYSISSSAYTEVPVSGLKVKSTSFTVNASSTDWIAFGPFTVTLTKIDFVSLTFDKPGSATNNITVNVKDADGDAIPGVTASLESTSCTEFMTGSAAALSRTTNSVLAPKSYANDQGSTITYTFKVEGLPTTFSYNNAALDVYAMTSSGGAQGNSGNTVREWTFDVETGSSTDALASFVSQAGNDICTVTDTDGDLHHKLWTMAGSDKAATNVLYIKVTLTKTASLGCYAGLGKVQLFKPRATVKYQISDANGTVFTSDAVDTTIGTTITELPSEYQRAFCSYTVISTTMVEGENTVPVTVTYSLPFTVSTDYASATWYYLHGHATYSNYYISTNGDATVWNTTFARDDAHQWAFIGNPYEGIKVINKAAGDGKYLMATNPATMGTTAKAWTLKQQTNTSYTNAGGNGFGLYDATLGYLNTQYETLWYWNSFDQGSTFWVEEIPDDYSANVEAEIKPWFEDYGGYFQLKSDVVSANRSKYEAALTSCDLATYEELLAILADADNYVYPATGFYRIKSSGGRAAGETYITYGYCSDKTKYGLVTTPVANKYTDAGTIIKLTETETAGVYTMSLQGLNVLDESAYNMPFTATESTGDTFAFEPLAPGVVGIRHNNSDSYDYLHESGWSSPSGVVRWESSAIQSQWTVEDAATLNDGAYALTINMNDGGDNMYYATTYLPFDVTISGTTAYTLEKSGSYLVPTQLTDNKVPAGTAVLLKGTSATATATINTDAAFTTNNNNSLSGSYVEKDFALTDGATAEYFLGMDNGTVGFYHSGYESKSGYYTLGANRAYLSTTSSARGFAISWDDASSVQDLKNSEDVKNAVVYDLQGRRIENPQHGMYIKNGRVIVVK